MFVELTADPAWHPQAGRPFLVNSLSIHIVQPRKGGCLVITKDMTYYVTDEYDKLKRRLP